MKKLGVKNSLGGMSPSQDQESPLILDLSKMLQMLAKWMYLDLSPQTPSPCGKSKELVCE